MLNIIKRDRKNFQIILLSANKNYKKLFKQASYFNVKNLIISDKKVYDKLIKSKKLKNIKLYNSFNDFDKILKSKKIDYIMSAITGIEGLNPTLNIIKYTKKIAIANKEAIICGWNLIQKKLNYYKVEFIPVDSEHFSIWYGAKNVSSKYIESIFNSFGRPIFK